MSKENQKRPSRRKASSGVPSKDKRLGRMVMLSGLLHVVLLLALVSAAAPSRSKPRTPQSYTVSLVAPTALEPAPAPPPPQVEVKEPQVEAKKPKAEPKKPNVEAKKPKAQAQPPKVEAKKPERKPVVATPKEPVKIAAKKKPRPKKAAAQKPPAQQPERAKKPPAEEPEEHGLSAEDREQQIVAALEKVRQRVQADRRQAAETSHSTSASGGGGGDTLRGLPFILYTQEVKQRVKQSWIVAEHKSGLTAVVRFGILADGEVVGVELAERSGDSVFDESAMRAVRKADPLPPPPEAYRNEFTRQKIEVVFGEPRRARSQQVRSE